MAKKKRKKVEEWTPLQPATMHPLPPDEEARLMEWMMGLGKTEEEAYAALQESRKGRVFMNDLYTVIVNPVAHNRDMVHLSIRRNDRGPCLDWRHKQRIKDELVGPECEGIELYPANSRLVDTANQFHLWCVKDPTYRFPVGFPERLVDYQEKDGVKAQQREL